MSAIRRIASLKFPQQVLLRSNATVSSQSKLTGLRSGQSTSQIFATRNASGNSSARSNASSQQDEWQQNHEQYERSNSSSSSTSTNSTQHHKYGALIASAIAIYGGAYYLYKGHKNVHAAQTFYSADDISKHNSLENGIWVAYGNDVFDITEFVENHPGGQKIMMAAGKAIEPFWDTYTLHKNTEVKELLMQMWIGKLSNTEKKKLDKNAIKPGAVKPYSHEPSRDDRFLVNSKQPFDGETPPSEIVKSFQTPNNLFYVRNHLPVPKVDPAKYELKIEIEGDTPISISLHDLKTKFKKHEITATLQCAGNRRGEMSQHKPIFGAKAGFTAISNAVWGGVMLKDVLKHAGLAYGHENIHHIHFEGLDHDMGGEHYGASIPMEKAMGRHEDILLAYEMNGEELPGDHGYPVRVVIPGVIGARSVKWLGRIVASIDESKSFWQMLDYKSSPPSAIQNKFDFRESPPIYETPVNSAVCVPAEGSKISATQKEITVEGYAYSGGGRGVLRVDVTIDGGKTWFTADLDQHDRNTYKNWAWTLWNVDIPIPENADRKKLEILCKAVDSHHNVQPESISSIWNLRGFLNNAWHKVEVEIE